MVAKIWGERTTVRCSHHQAIDVMGRGLVVTARSTDGLIEAVELPEAPFVVGVQWHPEEDLDRRPFEALLDAAT
jgi:putative glutamine amidotransferase